MTKSAASVPAQKSRHYLFHEESAWLPAVGILLNLLFVCFVLLQVHALHRRIKLSISDRPGVASSTKAVASIGLTSGTLSLDGRRYDSASELVGPLSGKSAQGTFIRLRVTPDASWERVSEILQTLARSGFTNVAVEIAEMRPNLTPATGNNR